MDVAPVELPVLSFTLRPEVQLDELATSVRARLDAAGGDWTWHVDAPWASVGRAGLEVPEQGWKLHVAATEASALAVLDAAVPVLLAEGVPFKFAAARRYVRALNAATAARESGGKFLTVYPRDDAQAVRLAEACHQATAGLAGPVILSDRPYRPGSLVHYRYGGFRAKPSIDADGMIFHTLRSPSGEIVPDERSPSYQAPSWVIDPFQASVPSPAPEVPEAPAPAGPVLLNDRYLVRGALRHANKGGVYLAEDRQTGTLVVLKEGRPHVAGDAAGDARDRIRHEARMLALVAGVAQAPRLVEVFEQQGHVFLVEKHVPYPTLRDVVDGAFDPPEPGMSAGDVVILTARAAETMAAFHAAGVVLRDFNPNNLLIGPNDDFVLVDFELAHPLGEAPGPASGTPGYASPEQLQGQPSGQADDYWSLGATIAHLATGADPYLPADVNHTWTDPDRLQAWVEGQVDDGMVEAHIAEVVLGCMAPRPQDRWSPEAVLAALRGEGRRTVPVRGPGHRRTGVDKPARRHPRPAADRLSELNAIQGDVVGWLLSRLGHGQSGHLWPAGPSGMSLDPINVQTGASGVGLFLCQASRAEEDDTRRAELQHAIGVAADWVASQIDRGPERPPGLYFGLSGAAWFLTEASLVLGRDDLLRRANELALSLPVAVPNADITHGTAGVGLGQLHQWARSGDDRFLARAVVAAEHIMRSAQRHDTKNRSAGPAVTWPVPASAPSRLAGTTSYGFAHGNAGIATFLLYAGTATGEAAFTALALESLDALLPFAVDVGGAAYWPSGAGDDAEELWPHWCSGSSGIGTALIRAFAVTGNRRYRRAAEGAAAAVLRERWRSSAVQCHGLAGDAELLLDLGSFTGEPRFAALALVAAEALELKRRADDNFTVFADDTGSGVDAGFGVGIAGVGSYLSRLVSGGPRLLLLDELLATRAGA
jgi:hypothetical protein